MKTFYVNKITQTGGNAQTKQVMTGALSESAYHATLKLELKNPTKYEILITDTETEQTDLFFIPGIAELRKIMTMDRA
jgi:hypothetical protein